MAIQALDGDVVQGSCNKEEGGMGWGEETVRCMDLLEEEQ